MKTASFTVLAIAALNLSLNFSYAKDAKEPAKAPESMAVYMLRQLNEREQEAYAKYDIAVESGDVDQVRRELQSIIDGYDSLIGQAPYHAPAYVSYGLMLNRTGNREESYAMFLKADELDPMLPVVKNQLGNYMAEEGRYAEAFGFFLMARDLNPKESLYDYQIGNLLVGYRLHFIKDKIYTSEEIDQQITEHFREAMLHSPKDISFRMRYAQSYFDIEHPNWEDALEVWQKLYDYAGDEYEKQVVRLYIARVRLELGHHTAARKLLDKIDHPSLDESKATLLEELDREHPR